MKQTQSQARIRCAFLSVFLLGCLVFASIPQAHATTVMQTRHFTTLTGSGSGMSTWATFANYYLQEDLISSAYDSAERIVTGNTRACQWSIDVGTLNWYGNVTNTIGTKVAMVERDTNGQGYQSGYWNSTETNMTRLDGLQIWVYMRTRLGATYTSWVLLSGFSTGLDNFITEHVGMDKLLASMWNVTYYTERHTVTTYVHGIFHLGNETMDSKIENIQFDNGVTTPIPPGKSPSWIASGAYIILLTLSLMFIIGIVIIAKRRR